jgi:aspartate dehydrogenase
VATKIGLIGCGAIGTVLAEAIERKLIVCDELVVYDVDITKSRMLQRSLKFPVKIVSNLEEMIAVKPKVIVEAAGQKAVREYYSRLLQSKIDFIVMSTGALLELDTSSSKLHFPAGAIGGLDALEAASNAGIDEINLTSRKNPKAFGKSNLQESIIFEGLAEEAAKMYPREMNVAATIALTVKPARVKVQVISDPNINRNTHEIHVKWRFGEINMRFANEPHPDNPHTSALAAWSAISLLKILIKK